jgi:3-hydroxy-9,10-secoandrosta-1,3,5(10)-triene-9,17-dione monooxygenase
MTVSTRDIIQPPEPSLTEEQLIERAGALRDHLRSEQDNTDERGTYSPATHELFRQAGFYRTLLPRRYGGYEFDVPTFARVIIEIARGCPGTGWCLCLAAGHGLQMGSLFSEEAQSAAFSPDGEFAAPLRGVPMGTATHQPNGEWRIDGTWDYCSGAPYSTHAMVGVRMLGEQGSMGIGIALVPRDGWTLLDDWRGRTFGMIGSGSNSIRIEGALVPDSFVVAGNLLQFDGGLETPGYQLHGNPMYAGHPLGYLQIEISSVLVGTAYAALDEYERILSSKKTIGPNPVERFRVSSYQRYWGLAAGKIHAAEDVLIQESIRYMEACQETAANGGRVEPESLMRVNAATHHAVNLVWEAVELLFRTGGTSEGGRNGSKMQRYYRDCSTARTNIGLQHESFAEVYAMQHFGLQVAALA